MSSTQPAAVTSLGRTRKESLMNGGSRQDTNCIKHGNSRKVRVQLPFFFPPRETSRNDPLSWLISQLEEAKGRKSRLNQQPPRLLRNGTSPIATFPRPTRNTLERSTARVPFLFTETPSLLVSLAHQKDKHSPANNPGNVYPPLPVVTSRRPPRICNPPAAPKTRPQQARPAPLLLRHLPTNKRIRAEKDYHVETKVAGGRIRERAHTSPS